VCGKQDHIRNGKEIYAMEVETERQALGGGCLWQHWPHGLDRFNGDVQIWVQAQWFSAVSLCRETGQNGIGKCAASRIISVTVRRYTQWKLRDTLIAKTDGRVDGANAREFQTALDAAIDDNEFSVVLDMEQLSYISSAGLRVILLTAKALQGRNRKFAICALSESIREVFEISGFDKIISIHASRSDALAAFNN
jgi:anti-anti-sigma factor